MRERIKRNSTIERFGACSRACSAKLHSNSEEIKKKKEENILKKYGSIESWKKHMSEERKRKLKEKYSTEEAWKEHFAEAYEKAKQTYMKKLGVPHNMLNPESVKKNQERRVATLRSFSKERKEEWARKRMEAYEKKGNLFGGKRPKNSTHSKEANEFISILLEDDFFKDKKCYYGENEKQFKGPVKYSRYYIDFYDEDDNIGIEFYGDYWHASKERYEDDDLIKYKGREEMTAAEVREKDRQRIDFLEKEYGIKMYVLWENEFLKDKKEAVNSILNAIKNSA